jgi:vacuolar protein sorting-associated protein 35
VCQAAPPEDQARLLEEALAIVRAHATSMKRCIDRLQILDSLKHASMMLAELRSSSLGPKHYYELCIFPLHSTPHLLFHSSGLMM